MRMPSSSPTASTAALMELLTCSIFVIMPAFTPCEGFETMLRTTGRPSASRSATATTTFDDPRSIATM